MQNSPKKPHQNIVTRIILVTLGSALFSFNVNTFVHTAGLFPGGFAGIALLLQAVCERFFGFHLPYAPVSLLLNAFPVYISFRFIGRKFTLLSCLSILLTSILTDVLPGVQITSEPVLVSIFGGMINGAAIGMCLLADATSGGTDFISIYLSEQHGKDSFNLILGLNAVVLSLAGLFFGWERALYSIIFQFASTQVIHLVYRRYQKQTLLIITEHPETVSKVISDITHHGATMFTGKGMYEMCERTMVYSIVAADEVRHVTASVRAVDPTAFINCLKTDSVEGRFYRRPND